MPPIDLFCTAGVSPPGTNDIPVLALARRPVALFPKLYSMTNLTAGHVSGGNARRESAGETP